MNNGINGIFRIAFLVTYSASADGESLIASLPSSGAKSDFYIPLQYNIH